MDAANWRFANLVMSVAATGATDPEGRAKVEAQVPLGRLGTAPLAGLRVVELGSTARTSAATPTCSCSRCSRRPTA